MKTAGEPICAPNEAGTWVEFADVVGIGPWEREALPPKRPDPEQIRWLRRPFLRQHTPGLGGRHPGSVPEYASKRLLAYQPWKRASGAGNRAGAWLPIEQAPRTDLHSGLR